ncbi:hypothetical protein SP15_006 [Bacillus phage SP-15]|uniref:Uncharacterized protein n=1 Tax=Bacillus phage SP-15 TaxID=1792032 RepID=A0A127AX27_9CAUD|nr:hypothetical protein SP15_006 [Bacillus phage SP-15]AMM44804.1 hypothetical protein SP15_006 [Bacillus phage SP-15]
MFTKDTLEELRNLPRPENFGSDPRPLFKDGVFNPDNWNGGDAIPLEKYVHHLDVTPFHKYHHRVIPDIFNPDGDGEYSVDLMESLYHCNDVCFVTFLMKDTGSDGGFSNYFPESTNTLVYEKYKSRGHISNLLFNGKPITEDEYLKFLNLLSESGYKF